jgi:hypothetical protein
MGYTDQGLGATRSLSVVRQDDGHPHKVLIVGVWGVVQPSVTGIWVVVQPGKYSGF